jgi:hypothetical protein
MNDIALTSWTSFKVYLAEKSGLIQYVQFPAYYEIYFFEASFRYVVSIYMDGGADQVDFETNFKPSANAPVPLPVTITGDPFFLSENIAEWGGVATSLGQKVSASSVPVTIASDQPAFQVTQSGLWNINNISGTISLPAGAATSSKQPSLGTAGSPSTDVISVQGVPGGTAINVNGSGFTQPVSGTVTANIGTTGGLALDSSVSGLSLTQSSTTSSQHGVLDMGAVTTSAPTYVSGQTDPLSLNTSGGLRVDGSGVTQPVSGTVTANAGTGTFTVGQATGTNLHVVVDSGTVAATQTGTWNINNITGTVSLPTGAATQASQTTGNASLASIDSKLTDTGGGALKVDGSAVTQPVSGTITANAGTGNFTVVQPTGTNLHTVVDNFPATQPVSGTVTANAGTGTFTVGQSTAANLNATVVGSGNFTVVQPSGASLHVDVDNFPATQPVSGTVTANQGTSPWVTSDLADGSVAPGTAGTKSMLAGGVYNTATPTLTNGQQVALQTDVNGNLKTTAVLSGSTVTVIQPTAAQLNATVVGSGNFTVVQPTGSNLHVDVDNFPATQPVSGTVTANAGSGNFQVVQPTGTNLHTVVDSGTITVTQATGTNLHTVVDSGAVTVTNVNPANLNALVAGAVTSAAPLYVNGTDASLSLNTAGGLRVDGSGVTQPVSGTVTANAGTGNFTVVQATGANLHVDVDNFPATQPVSGTVTANQGTSPWVVSGTVTSNIGTTGGLALDTTVAALQVAQASTTAGEKGTLTMGAVTTAAPTYTTGQTDPISLTTAGALRVDGSGTTQPVSGTVTANAGTGTFTVGQATGTNLHVVVDSGTTVVTQPTAANLNATVVGSGNFTVVQPTGTNLHTVVDSGTVTANIGTTNGLALDATVAKLTLAQASTTAGETGPLIQGAVTTAAPAYTTGQTDPLSLTTAGSLRVVDNSTVAQASTTSGQTGGLIQGAVTTAAPSYTTGQTDPLSLTTAGSLRVTDTNAVAQASTTAGEIGPLVQGAVTTADPAYTTAQTDPLSLTTTGRLRVDATGNVASLAADSGNPVKVGAVYNTTPSAPTTGQRVDLQANQFGALSISQRNKFLNIAGNATTTVKSGAGTLSCVTINNPGSGGTCTIYDNTAGSGTIIMTLTISSGGVNPVSTALSNLGCEFATGLTVVTAGSAANNFTFFYR